MCSGIYDSWFAMQPEFFALKDLYKITGNRKKREELVPGAFSIVVSQGFRLVWREALRS